MANESWALPDLTDLEEFVCFGFAPDGKPYAAVRVTKGLVKNGYWITQSREIVLRPFEEKDVAVDSEKLQVEAQSQPDIIASGPRRSPGKRNFTRGWLGENRDSHGE